MHRFGPKLYLSWVATQWVVSAALLLYALPCLAQPQEPLAPQAQALSQEFSRIISTVGPAVVHIATVRIVEVPPGPEGLLREFFGGQLPEGFQGNGGQQRQEGLGSGVIVSADGYILTNNHVVAEASKLTVVLSDKRRFTAEVVGTDPPTDIAVLKIDAQDLPIAPLGSSDRLQAGNLILAMGSPFGLQYSVTAGIVSATGRANVGIAEYEDFIQTDAAINPGNSGGPLVNMQGEIVGINTAILSRTGGSMGLGFAVPIDMARTIMRAIIDNGRVVRGWLGVSIQDLTPELAEALGVERRAGALVSDILPDTPAAGSELQRGDLVIAVNGKAVQSAADLRNVIAGVKPGTAQKLTVLRNGDTQEVAVTVGERPVHGAEAVGTHDTLGLEVRDLTPELRQQFGIERDIGILVVGVRRDGSAAEAGIRPGMLILQVNRQDVANVHEFNQALRQVGPNQNILLLVSYRGRTNYVLLRQEVK